MRSALFMLLAAVVLASSAAAQDTGDPAAALIAREGVEDVFAPMEGDGETSAVRVRHRGSGMVCVFYPPAPHRIVLFSGLPRGEDAACDLRLGDAFVTLYATRYPEPTTNREQLDGARAQIEDRFRDATLTPIELQPDQAPTTPESLSAGFLVAAPDAVPLFTWVSVAVVDGWTIKLRFSRPAPSDDARAQAERMADALWRRTLQDRAETPDDAAGP
ncbi:MAG: hypothetical protein GC206_12115 [Alphaproteobacteria bacterium]|nr:hypothetical protein [Alphaproteobacteria bacterium]